MQLHVRAFAKYDAESVVRLSLRAWEPVFASTRQVLGADIDTALQPDPSAAQKRAVEAACASLTMRVWVAEVEARVVGFVAVNLHDDARIGEIYMLAVDPDYQGDGIGTRLTEFVLEWMRTSGVPVAMVETGGDPGQAPARRTYEKAGFTLAPVARYFKKL